jgi:hypothetical protein
MRPFIAQLIVIASLAGSAIGQTAANSFPAGVFTAKTIAILNDTKSAQVSDGAASALKAWGQFTVVDDPESADITLRFDKSTQHEGQTTEKNDANGNPSDRSYSLSFSSKVRMRVYYKDADTPFYTTKTDESKAKAGIECINDFRGAYRAAHPHP